MFIPIPNAPKSALFLAHQVFGAVALNDAAEGEKKNRLSDLSALSVEQQALRRIQCYVKWARTLEAVEHEEATQAAIQTLRKLVADQTLSPHGIECVVQQALDLSSQISPDPFSRRGHQAIALSVFELACEALGSASSWNWWSPSWEAKSGSARPARDSVPLALLDASAVMQVEAKSSWFNRLFWPATCAFREQVLAAGLLDHVIASNDITPVMDSLFGDPQCTGDVGALGGIGAAGGAGGLWIHQLPSGLPPLSVLRRVVKTLGLEDKPVVINTGEPVLVHILKGTTMQTRDAFDAPGWAQLLMDAPHQAWLRHDHTNDPVRRGLDAGPNAQAAPPHAHPLWALGAASAKPF